MRFLINSDSVVGVDGKPIEGPEGAVSVGELLRLCLNEYQPQKDQVLTVSDWRSINKVFDVLNAGEGTMAFEDTDYNIMVKAIEWVVPIVLRRSSPILVDLLSTAPKKDPSANGTSDEHVPEQTKKAAKASAKA